MPLEVRVPDRIETKRVEQHRLGASLLLEGRSSGALIITNDFGHAVLRALRAGADVADLDPSSRLLLDEWSAAGLFDAGPASFADPVAPSIATGDALTFGRDGTPDVCVRSDATELTEQLRLSLAHYLCDGLGDHDGSIPMIDVVQAGDGFGVFRDGHPVWGRAPADLTRFHVLREVMADVTGGNLSAMLHGAALAKGREAVLVVGGSGAGKTTLSLQGALAGLTLAADDHIAIDAAGRLAAFPTRSALKEATQNMAAAAGLQPVGWRDGAVMVDAPLQAEPGQRFDIVGIVFPRYEEGARGTSEALPPEEVFTRLIQTGGRVAPGATAARLSELVSQVPAVAICHGDGDWALDRIARFWT